MPLCPGSRTVRLIPSCGNSIGGSPYSLANQHVAPLVSEENHSASRTLTTNQPSVTGASPEPASSSLASFTEQILAAQATAISLGPLFRNDARAAELKRRFSARYQAHVRRRDRCSVGPARTRRTTSDYGDGGWGNRRLTKIGEAPWLMSTGQTAAPLD